MFPLISVIIPIYDTEQYLEECFSSVIRQTYPNLEVILINDGSTDGSLDICKKYVRIDDRFKLIDKVNEGVAFARNVGLDHATGEYIVWLDSDDHIRRSYIEDLYQESQKNGGAPLMVIRHKALAKKYRKLVGEQIVDHFLVGDLPSMIWCTFFKKELYEGVRFNDYRIGEDEMMLIELLGKIHTLFCVCNMDYIYRDNPDSVTRTKEIDAIRSWIKETEALRQIVYNRFPYARSSMCYKIVIFAVQNLVLYRDKEIQSEAWRMLKRDFFQIQWHRLPIFHIKRFLVSVLRVLKKRFICARYMGREKKVKHLAIITICDMLNYGNRLQNYAVEIVLGRILDGYKIETLELGTGIPCWLQDIENGIHRLTNFRFSKRPGYWRCQYGRYRNFRKFTREYIHSRRVRSLEGLQKMDIDYFVFGSDQIWNAKWYDASNWRYYVYMGEFCTKAKKIAYAASFGRDHVPKQWRRHFQKGLEGFHAISVREGSGAKIVNGLTGRDVPVVIDPTLMLTAEDWMKIMHRPPGSIDGPYVLCYFLGDMPEKAAERLQMLRKKERFQTIDMMDQKGHFYSTDPGGFLYLLSRAGLIMTDSFHACIFAVLFKIPFLVYAREGVENDMITRIETLLDKLDLRRKYVGGGEENDIFGCDYEVAFERLKAERKAAESYLHEAVR